MGFVSTTSGRVKQSEITAYHAIGRHLLHDKKTASYEYGLFELFFYGEAPSETPKLNHGRLFPNMCIITREQTLALLTLACHRLHAMPETFSFLSNKETKSSSL